MIETVISLLITLCILAICVYLVIWVLGVLGIAIPQKVVQILWVIVVLVAILMIIRVIPLRLGAVMDGARTRVASITQTVKNMPAKLLPWKFTKPIETVT
jgi:uncharacterized membrane protein